MKNVIVKEKPSGSQDKELIIVAGTKVSKKATDRNLIKRRIRSIFRELTKKGNKEYTVIVRSNALNLDFKQLKQEIKKQINN